jgi:SAM-dependent methyltransferase
VFLPCAPALLDEYTRLLVELFAALRRPFLDGDAHELRRQLGPVLQEGYASSPHSLLVVRYGPHLATGGVHYDFEIVQRSVAQTYQDWVSPEPAALGGHADAMVLDVAAGLGDPALAPVLDVGAGTGRNTLALARRGHPVTAVELSPALAAEIQRAVQTEWLGVSVRVADVLGPEFVPPRDYYALALLAEVTSHFRAAAQLRTALSRLSEALRPGGVLLFNAFVGVHGWEPDASVRQLAQVLWSGMYSEAEMHSALAELTLQVEAREPCFEYERAHLPLGAWPPAPWFPEWASGRDVFDLPWDGQPPIALYWYVCRKL